MNYMLGSQTESMAFAGDGIQYQASGLAHAVNSASAINSPGAVLAYAICGQAVRAWPDQPFDTNASHTHDRCAAVATQS